MIERLNSLEHFFDTCIDKTDFEFNEIGLLPDHPLCYGHSSKKSTYFVSDLYLVFVQDGGRLPYTIYLNLQRWCPDSYGAITFEELKEFPEDIKLITFFDEGLEKDFIDNGTYAYNNADVLIYRRDDD